VLSTRATRQRTHDRRVLATVWWYSVSSVLLTPVLAGLVTGVQLSARLEDTTLHLLSGQTPVAATTRAGAGDVAADLRTAIAAVVAAVAEAGSVRERPLWAIATDSLANRLLAVGRAGGRPAACCTGCRSRGSAPPAPGVRRPTGWSCSRTPQPGWPDLARRMGQGRNSIESPNSCQRYPPATAAA
jgi:hypothetical protein